MGGVCLNRRVYPFQNFTHAAAKRSETPHLARTWHGQVEDGFDLQQLLAYKNKSHQSA